MGSRYTIDYQGFKAGHHHFTMPFGDDLFDIDADGEIISGSGAVEIDMERGERLMELNISIKGQICLQCDRCADEYMQDVDYSEELIVKISELSDEFNEEQHGDVIWLSPRQTVLDLKQWIYESVVLSLPIMRIHQNANDCNKETLKYLNGSI